MNHSSTFATKNLSLAAALLATGEVQVSGVTRDDEIAWISLGPPAVCQELETRYFNNSLTVNAKAMSGWVKDLKNLIFESKEFIR